MDSGYRRVVYEQSTQSALSRTAYDSSSNHQRRYISMAKKTTTSETSTADSLLPPQGKSTKMTTDPTVQSETPAAPSSDVSQANASPSRRIADMPVWAIVAAGCAVLLLIISGFFAMFGIFRAMLHTNSRESVSVSTERPSFSDNGGMSERGWIRGDLGDTDTNSDRTVVSGVVTAVDGSTLTVAGNGTTTKVVVNDDTTYRGSSKPAAINDTIRVVGTTSNDTVTATTVYLSRR